jgi:hypothetical protein
VRLHLLAACVRNDVTEDVVLTLRPRGQLCCVPALETACPWRATARGAEEPAARPQSRLGRGVQVRG